MLGNLTECWGVTCECNGLGCHPKGVKLLHASKTRLRYQQLWATRAKKALLLYLTQLPVTSFKKIHLFFNCKKIEPQNKRLLEIRNKSLCEQKRVLRDQRKAALKEKKEKSEAEALLSAVKVCGL